MENTKRQAYSADNYDYLIVCLGVVVKMWDAESMVSSPSFSFVEDPSFITSVDEGENIKVVCRFRYELINNAA